MSVTESFLQWYEYQLSPSEKQVLCDFLRGWLNQTPPQQNAGLPTLAVVEPPRNKPLSQKQIQVRLPYSGITGGPVPKENEHAINIECPNCKSKLIIDIN